MAKLSLLADAPALIQAAVAIGAARCQRDLSAVHNIIGTDTVNLNGNFLPLLENEIGNRRTALFARSAWWKKIIPRELPTARRPADLISFGGVIINGNWRWRAPCLRRLPPTLRMANWLPSRSSATRFAGASRCTLSKREIARRAQIVRTIVCRAQRAAIELELDQGRRRSAARAKRTSRASSRSFGTSGRPGSFRKPSRLEFKRKKSSLAEERSDLQQTLGAPTCARKPTTYIINREIVAEQGEADADETMGRRQRNGPGASRSTLRP